MLTEIATSKTKQPTTSPQRNLWLLVAPFALGGVFLATPFGRLSLYELILIAIVPSALMLKRERLGIAGKYAPAAITLFAALACASLVNNAVTATSAAQLAANYALVGAIAGHVALILRHSDRDRRASTGTEKLVAATGVGILIGAIAVNASPTFAIAWKFGIGVGVTYLYLGGIAPRLSSRFAQVACGLLLAGTHLLMGSRGLAMVTIVAVLLASKSSIDNLKHCGKRRTKAKGFPIQHWPTRARRGVVVLVAATGLIALQTVAVLAGSGLLGENAQEKLSAQNGDYGILIGARKDVIFLLVGIINHPVFGLGPEAIGDSESRISVANWLSNHNYMLSVGDIERLAGGDGYALHSVALAAILQCGILALPAIVLIARILTNGLKLASTDCPAAMFVVLAGCVHFAFSPLGDSTRLPFGMALGIAIHLAIGSQRLHQVSRGTR